MKLFNEISKAIFEFLMLLYILLFLGNLLMDGFIFAVLSTNIMLLLILLSGIVFVVSSRQKV